MQRFGVTIVDKCAVIIAPNFTLADINSPPTLENKIEVFQRRVIGWQIDIADQLLQKIEDSGFAALAVLGSYPEMMWQYRNGQLSKGKSRQAFCEEMTRIYPLFDLKYPQNKDALDRIYDEVRCGMYHSGITKKRVALSGSFNSAIEIALDGSVKVNPHLWPEDFRQYLYNYIAQLRDTRNEDLRQKFETRFGMRG
jgi:hypothetical protein